MFAVNLRYSEKSVTFVAAFQFQQTVLNVQDFERVIIHSFFQNNILPCESVFSCFYSLL